MYKFIRAYEKGFNEGIKDALKDKKQKRCKKFKKIDEIIIESKLYDIGYIKGYSIFNKNNINTTLKSNKNIV